MLKTTARSSDSTKVHLEQGGLPNPKCYITHPIEWINETYNWKKYVVRKSQ